MDKRGKFADTENGLKLSRRGTTSNNSFIYLTLLLTDFELRTEFSRWIYGPSAESAGHKSECGKTRVLVDGSNRGKGFQFNSNFYI